MEVEPVGLTEDAVRNVVLTWYHGTNEHMPVERIERMLSEDVEMRYPNNPEPLIGRNAFRRWYQDVLAKYFDETHKVESWSIQVNANEAVAVVVVRWETRSWQTGAARSEYRAFLSRQRFEVARRADGKIEITAKIAETFTPTAPVYQVES